MEWEFKDLEIVTVPNGQNGGGPNTLNKRPPPPPRTEYVVCYKSS